jgi:ubiquinone/menaquinone biosynthesis C-methylase UbiE
MEKNRKSTRRPRPGGWDAVAAWYDGWVGKGGSQYHRRLAVPATLQLLDARPGEAIIDIGAGQGVLAPFIAQAGAVYTGIEVSPKLLALARQHHGEHGRFLRADAARLNEQSAMQAELFDGAVFLLSIQDMNPLDEVLRSATWVLKPGGRIVILMTHPCFRVPRQSGWGFDEGRKLQFRRVDRYLTPLPVPMKQHPGSKSGVTISFHRPLSEYINTMAACGLLLDRMEEIPLGDASLKKDRSKAEKLADDEIPLFLGLRAHKLSV